jgi:hypothetical protein
MLSPFPFALWYIHQYAKVYNQSKRARNEAQRLMAKEAIALDELQSFMSTLGTIPSRFREDGQYMGLELRVDHECFYCVEREDTPPFPRKQMKRILENASYQRSLEAFFQAAAGSDAEAGDAAQQT